MSTISYLTEARCNIFCELGTKEEVLEYLSTILVEGSSVETCYDDDSRFIILVVNNEVSIKFSVSLQEKGGDRTAKVLLGASNFIRNIETDAACNKDYIDECLDECNAFIGIHALPVLSVDYGHVAYLEKMTEHFEGLIFNGVAFLDCNGRMILNSDGECTVLYEERG